jgi:hypothetical protein
MRLFPFYGTVASSFWIVAFWSAVAQGVARERMFVNPSSFHLAPGREAWISVSTYAQPHPNRMHPIPADIAVESSDSSVATVALDSGRYVRVLAVARGSAQVIVRSKREPNNVRRIPVVVAPAPVRNEAGLITTATAKLRLTSAAPGARLGPMELDVTVTISNPTRESRDIWLSPCTAWIRIHWTRDRSDRPVGGVPRDVECGPARHFTFAPLQSRSFPAGGYRLTLDPDTLGTGRYYVTALVDRVRDLYEVDAGAIDIVSPNAGLRLDATTEVREGRLRARVTVRNTNREAVRLEYGACSVTLLAHTTAERVGKPLWNSRFRRDPNGIAYACPSYLAVVTLNAGQSLSPGEFNPGFPISEVLGDSLPAGRYFLTAEVRLNWRLMSVPAGAVTIGR